MGIGHRRGGQNPDELQPHGRIVPFRPLHEAVRPSSACPLLHGHEGGQGRENHLAKDMGGACRRVRALFPELVDTGFAAPGGSGRGSVYPYYRHRLCLPDDGRSVDEPPAETQPDG